jgi:hypothetical protein
MGDSSLGWGCADSQMLPQPKQPLGPTGILSGHLQVSGRAERARKMGTRDVEAIWAWRKQIPLMGGWS